MTKETTSEFRAIVLLAILASTIKKAGPEGAPEGPMYAAMMQAGYTFENFERAMSLLVKKGMIRRSGHVAYYIEQE
jgi:hypothetical protein